MNLKIILFIFLCILTSCLTSNNVLKVIKLKNVKFESIFGTMESKPNNTYCLLGTGFFRTPRSDNSDSLISNWIQLHPEAIVVPVCSHGPVMIDNPDSKMIYCWIIDQKDTLNIFLVRKGCFPGGTMIRPETWEEMEEWEKELYDESGQKPDVRVLVKEEIYQNLIDQVMAAESYAEREEKGIWKSH